MRLQSEQVFLRVREEESETDKSLRRLNEIAFKAQSLECKDAKSDVSPPWQEDFFALRTSALYQSFNPEVRSQVLARLCDGLLLEAFYIESAGMSYAAKMNLLAETIDERVFFSQMGQEEAQHFVRLRPWFPRNLAARPPSSFSNLIGEIIQNGSRRSGLFLIQILLEGWGLFYYQTLCDKTVNPAIAEAFKSILQDETRHYSSGVLLFDRATADRESNEYIRSALTQVLAMVRVGPQTVLAELARAAGGLSDVSTIKTLEQLGAVESTESNLRRLKKTIERSLPRELIDFCMQEDLFTAMSLEEMKQVGQSLST